MFKEGGKPFGEQRVIIAIVGALGRGKSTVAYSISKHLSELSGLPEPIKVHSTDEIRNEFVERSLIKKSLEGINEGAFSPRERDKIYNELMRRIKNDLNEKGLAVATGTFINKSQRESLYEIARDFGAKVFFIECLTTSEKAEERIAAAEAAGENRFGSLVGPKRYAELRKNPKTSKLTESPAVIKEENLKEFEENNVIYVPFATSFELGILPERTKMLTRRVIDYIRNLKKQKQK